MIILRQKEFTRASKRVFKELVKSTDHFRNLPKGVDNLGGRDAFRLLDLSDDLYKKLSGQGGKIDSENFKRIAKKLGLPETAENGEKIIEKLTNDRILDRYKRMKEYRLRKEAEERVKKTDDLVIEKFNKIKSKEARGENISDDFTELNDFIDSESRKNANYIKDKKDQDFKRTEKKFKNRIKKYIKSYKSAHDRLTSAQNAPKSSEDTALIGKAVEDAVKKYEIPVEGGDMTKIITDKFGNSVINIGKNGSYLGDLEHELGHYRIDKERQKRDDLPPISSFIKHSGGYNQDKKPINPFYALADEAGASIAALSEMKKNGATEEQLRRAKYNLQDAYRTYYHDNISRIDKQLTERFKT